MPAYENCFASFHNSNITDANAQRTGESSTTTCSTIINLREYLSMPYLPWNTDPLEFWYQQKRTGCLLPFLDVVSYFFCNLCYYRPFQDDFLPHWVNSFPKKEAYSALILLTCSCFLIGMHNFFPQISIQLMNNQISC